MSVTPESIRARLKQIVDPDLRADIVSLGYVKELEVDGGRVRFTIELGTHTSSVRETIAGQAQAVVSSLEGVESVDVSVTVRVRSATAPEKGGPPLPGVKNVIAVGAGKGGVGKTTVAVNLALALSKAGARVGVLDGDIYGPNVPLMLGLKAELTTDGRQIRPAEKFGLQIVSLAFMTGEDQAVIWRGPMVHSAIQQFFRDVGWSDLDYLVIDMPPGTGDVALSLSQTVAVAGAVVVTTPQQVSLADSRRAVRMYQKLNIPTLGIIENMSYYACPNCHHESDIFGFGGGEQIATTMDVAFLGRLPVYQPISLGSDRGIPIVIAEPDAPASRAFGQVAERVAAQVALNAHRSAVANKGKIPLIPVRGR
ncbi:MAG TPA: Mrp/NBP35 family ATP-binding protein [Vicinamibacterales bacterium]|nr:Mrp/NBP35 family ATP-binding protein [Vicinamibacterales bacterium]